MERRICLFITIWYIMMMSFVCARNMHDLLHQGQILKSSKNPHGIQEEKGIGRENAEEMLSRLGSRPPRCEHKCKGCNPCSPTQVPTAHLISPEYTNYEPEGWKCKCGSIFYNP